MTGRRIRSRDCSSVRYPCTTLPCTDAIVCHGRLADALFCLPIYIGSYTTYLEGGAEGTHVIFPVLMISCVHFQLSEKMNWGFNGIVQ